MVFCRWVEWPVGGVVFGYPGLRFSTPGAIALRPLWGLLPGVRKPGVGIGAVVGAKR